VALFTTALAGYLHFVFFRHAGGLWRDEVGTVNLAARARLGDVWNHLFYDSFPAFYILVVRVWRGVGLGSDDGLRLLGLLVGLSGLGVLWFNARLLKIGFPFFSLLLIGLNSVFIIWGDSIRAWGWGAVWILLTFGLIREVVASPSPVKVACAVLAAIGSVHSTYYNWVLVFALCCAGAVVACRRRLWKRAVLALGIGVAAGVSVVPYLIGMAHLHGHYLITQRPYDFAKYVTMLAMAVSDAGPGSGYVWGLLLIAALVMAVFCLVRPVELNVTAEQQDLLLFSVSALVVGAAGYFVFLRTLSFATQSWYYAALLAVAAMAIDGILSVLGNWERGRKLRLVFVTVALVLLTPTLWKDVPMRMTNTDLIARRLTQSAGPQDLIVVNPWYCGISFQYYYRGTSAWTTLPALEDHSYHCYEPVVRLMTNPDQMEVIRSVLDEITRTLKAGNRVWLVGGLSFPPGDEKPGVLAGAPRGPSGWWSTPYQLHWSSEAGYFVEHHVKSYGEFVVAPDNGRVNQAEYLPLEVVQGWKDQ
jgi:hypothetical protein